MGQKSQSPRRIRFQTCTVNENGELVHYEETTQFVAAGDGFVKVYDRARLQDALGDISYGAILQVLRRMNFADSGQLVKLDTDAKKEMAKSMGCTSDRQVERVVKKMVDAGLLRKVQRGLYQVNPFLFGKGKQGDIDALRTSYVKSQQKGPGGH